MPYVCEGANIERCKNHKHEQVQICFVCLVKERDTYIDRLENEILDMKKSIVDLQEKVEKLGTLFIHN